jgi:RNA polymerase sigma-70 factor (ECF subfamily)
MSQQKAMTEEALLSAIQSAQSGDTDAFGKIYDMYLTPVYRYVVFRFPRELAEDLVADIFVKAWEKLHTYVPQKGVPFAAWLFRIARHSVVDAYRRHRGFEEVSDDIPDDNRWNNPTQKIEHALLMKTVRKALNDLPRRYRDTLLLCYVSDLSNREAAKALRMTEGGLRILKFRALKKLENLLPLSLKDHV